MVLLVMDLIEDNKEPLVIKVFALSNEEFTTEVANNEALPDKDGQLVKMKYYASAKDVQSPMIVSG